MTADSREAVGPVPAGGHRRHHASPLGRLTVSALCACAALLAACSDGRDPLVVYSPHGRDLLTVVEEAFEAEHPEIDLRFLDMGSQEVLDRIRSERANPQADVWYGGPSTLFDQAAAEGLLQATIPSWSPSASALPVGRGLAPLRDATGTSAAAEPSPGGAPRRSEPFVASRAGPIADVRGRAPAAPVPPPAPSAYHVLYDTPTLILYNTTAVPAAEAPRDWPELLDPRWQDQILIRDPLASGTMRTIFGHLISSGAGFAYLLALDAQTKEYVHSPALLHEKLTRQEGLVSLWELTDTLNLMNRGAPLAYRFPTSGAPVILDSIALVRQRGSENDPMNTAATTFLEWIGSPAALRLAAEQAFRLPSRGILAAASAAGSDLEATLPPWVAEVRSQLVPADVDWSALAEHGAEWMRRWDREVRARGTSRGSE